MGSYLTGIQRPTTTLESTKLSFFYNCAAAYNNQSSYYEFFNCTFFYLFKVIIIFIF